MTFKDHACYIEESFAHIVTVSCLTALHSMLFIFPPQEHCIRSNVQAISLASLVAS